MEEHTDEETWDALEASHLEKDVKMMADGLQTEAGGAFSVGQKQLLCLARAVIRQPKILVLDEVTANVDIETDMKIQATIRERFAGCTQMAIAHRLATIIDSHKILVMEQGQLAEFDHPHTLLQNPDGIFYSLVNNDKENAAALTDIAKGTFESNPDAIHAQMRAFEERRVREHEEKVAAAVGEAKNHTSELEKLLERYDDALQARPSDSEAQFQMEELWKLLEGFRRRVDQTRYAKLHPTG